MTLAEALFLCRNKCRNETPVFAVHVVIARKSLYLANLESRYMTDLLEGGNENQKYKKMLMSF
jgi:hypothetical protein